MSILFEKTGHEIAVIATEYVLSNSFFRNARLLTVHTSLPLDIKVPSIKMLKCGNVNPYVMKTNILALQQTVTKAVTQISSRQMALAVYWHG